MSKITEELVAPLEQEMIEIRRKIHSEPELSNKEFETTKLITAKLNEYGIEIANIGMKTGVVALLKGARPGKTLAIREDIDALPMPEETGLPFASKFDNICHSCGHDIHTTVLIYCAKVLASIKDELVGSVLFLFQPAEEGGHGARQLIENKYYEVSKPDAHVGLHVAPLCDVGKISIKRGVSGASADGIRIKVIGKGGHGAHPENFVDPIAASAYLITQLQTVISRVAYPLHPGVFTIGSIHGGHAGNIVPDFVEMVGSLRSLDQGSRTKMQDAIDRVIKGCTEAMGCRAEVVWHKGMPPLVNDESICDGVEAAANTVLGPGHVMYKKDPSMGSEDFSELFPAYGPGAQFGLGTANDDPNSRIGIHNSKNIFDERCIKVGASVLVQYARDFLK